MDSFESHDPAQHRAPLRKSVTEAAIHQISFLSISEREQVVLTAMSHSAIQNAWDHHKLQETEIGISPKTSLTFAEEREDHCFPPYLPTQANQVYMSEHL